MDELRGVDINLVVVLDAVLASPSLTRAGETLGMSQPAVSAALAKLRKLLGDPLVVRTGRTVELTPHARELQPLVRMAVTEVARTFNMRPHFDPRSSERRFRLAASDYVLATMTRPLLELLRDEAPGASIEFSALNNVGPVDLLRQDVVIASSGRNVPGKRQSLFSDVFVCVVRKGHPRLADGALTLEDLAALPYIQVRIAPEILTVSDDALAAAGIVPHVAMIVPGFLAVPYMVAESDMYGLVPERIAELHLERLGLVAARTPLPASTLIEVVYWHPSRTNDPAVRWLVGILRKTAERVEFGADGEFGVERLLSAPVRRSRPTSP